MLEKLKIEILTIISYYFVRIIGRIPDKVMIFFLKLINNFLKNFKFEIVGFYLDDVLQVYQMGSPYTDIAKRILRESKERELKDLLRGIFEKD